MDCQSLSKEGLSTNLSTSLVPTAKTSRSKGSHEHGAAPRSLKEEVIMKSFSSIHIGSHASMNKHVQDPMVVVHMTKRYCLVKFCLKGIAKDPSFHRFTFSKDNNFLHYYFQLPNSKIDIKGMPVSKCH